MRNWKTTLSGTAAAVMSLVSLVAIAPETLGPAVEILPPQYKPMIFAASAIAAFVLRVVNSFVQKDKAAQ